MESNSIKIIECFDITGLGLITEIQHQFDGIPPNTHLIDSITNEGWIVKKRIHQGIHHHHHLNILLKKQTALKVLFLIPFVMLLLFYTNSEMLLDYVSLIC